jgi:hypothetical protein
MGNAIDDSLPGSLLDSLHAVFYVADFEKRTMISSTGNISNIIGRHPPDALMFPLELAEDLHHPKDRTMIRESLDGFGKTTPKPGLGFTGSNTTMANGYGSIRRSASVKTSTVLNIWWQGWSLTSLQECPPIRTWKP